MSSKARSSLLAMLFSANFLLPVPALADYSQNDKTKVFIAEMVKKHQFKQADLEAVFSEAEKKDSILKAIARPAEKRLEWSGYRKIFITKDRISKGKLFLEKFKNDLLRAEKTYGVPVEIIAAIIGVETRYGENKGSYRVIDALATLAFDYPPRGKFFKSELEHVLLLSKEQGFKPLELTGSYAGAMGYGQFIPSSYRSYAVDFDNDGVVDILNNPIDAIGSVANYFVKHKWHSNEKVAFQLNPSDKVDHSSLINKKLKPNYTVRDLRAANVLLPEGLSDAQAAKLQKLNGKLGEELWLTLHNFYVITRYNHSHLYAMAVFQLSEELK